MHSCCLIVFYRNPDLGQVKTRLASHLGAARALDIYLRMCTYTSKIVAKVKADVVVYYSRQVIHGDGWSDHHFFKKVQQGDTLGIRLDLAVQSEFAAGYRHVCVIGTDCLELTSVVIERAFLALQSNDAVVGPAYDGGYYLLGTNCYDSSLFDCKAWGTDAVLRATLHDFHTLGWSYDLLPTLRDVDEAEDLPVGWL